MDKKIIDREIDRLIGDSMFRFLDEVASLCAFTIGGKVIPTAWKWQVVTKDEDAIPDEFFQGTEAIYDAIAKSFFEESSDLKEQISLPEFTASIMSVMIYNFVKETMRKASEEQDEKSEKEQEAETSIGRAFVKKLTKSIASIIDEIKELEKIRGPHVEKDEA